MHGMTLKSVQARHGKFYYYNEDELVGLALATYGEYSEAEVPVFEKVLREGDVAIDVGANIGAFTIPMAQFVGPTGKVIAFEASTANAEILWMNAEVNELSDVIEIIPKAASDKIGAISITQQDALHAYTMRDLNAERFSIDCITIDSLNLQKCKLIKIDVDRHEYQVLEGARETIKRCFPAGTRVQSIGRIKELHRRWYEGPLVTLITRKGLKLTGTPNHPIITPQGETPLKDMKVGDYLFRTADLDGFRTEPVIGRTPDGNNKPPTIDQVFEAFSKTIRPKRMASSPLDFHGDGTADSHIDIIRPDSELWGYNNGRVKFKKKLLDAFFAFANKACSVGLVGLRSFGKGLRSVEMRAARSPLLFGVGLTPNLVLLSNSSNGNLAAFQNSNNDIFFNSKVLGYLRGALSGKVTIDNRFVRKGVPTSSFIPVLSPQLFSGSQFNTRGKQEAFDRRVIRSGQLSQSVQAQSLGVELDEVVSVEISGDWAGHVYNLETESGKYIAEGVVVSNCRPIIYIENEHADLKERLIATLIEMGYRLFWHKPFQFNPDNFFGEKRNIFANIVSVMNVCVPDEEGYEVRNLEEVMDIRNDDLMFDREITRFNRYVERNPDDLDSRLVVAHYSNLMQRTDEAYALLDENLRRDPAHGPSLAIRGLLDLQAQKYNRNTWAAYELRFQQKNLRQFGGDRIHKFGVPQWDGTPTDAPILIWSEQGFGDNIMFSRFMPEVLKRAPNAILETRPELYELFVFSRNCAYGRQKYPIYRLGRSLPDFEYHCSVPSLAWALGADDAMIKKYSAPYLFADPELVQNWKGLGTWSISVSPYPLNGARIGLCQSGSATSERPYTRDVPEELFSKMGRQFGPLFPLQQRGQFESFAMTAACIDALDLIITVDTSIAHLAGAMGKKTWLLLSTDSDFRWGPGEDQIWYPSMRVFKQQKFRDWQGVIDRVMTALEEEGF